MLLHNFQDKYKNTRFIVYLIIVIIFLCFYPVLNNTFVWDDCAYLLENPHYRGLKPENLSWMFTTFIDANYHPLSWISFGMDYTLWGMNPAGYHFTNLMFHVLNTILVFILILKIIDTSKNSGDMRGTTPVTIAAFVGALFFGLHPLRVEPVAWLCARGDLMCCFFYILTIKCYLSMADKKNRHRKHTWLLFSLFFYLLSLLSRAWGVTIPAVLLVLDVYPLNRFQWKRPLIKSNLRVLVEKIPFVFLSIIFSIPAFLAKKPAMASVSSHDMFDRVVQSIYGVIFYLYKTVIPVRFSPLYLLDRNEFNPFEPIYMVCFFLFIAIIVCLFVMRKKLRWAIAPFTIYIIIVSPLLGIIQSGPQITADRYTYISLLPFAVLAGAGVLKLFHLPAYRIPVTVFIIIILCFLAKSSFTQSRIWKDDITLWSHAIELNPHHEYAYYNRGLARSGRGDTNGAIEDYNMAIRFNPYNIKAYNNRGFIRMNKNDLEGALSDFNFSLKLNPKFAEAYGNKGIVYYKKKDYEKALENLNTALGLSPPDWKFKDMAQYFQKKSLEKLSSSHESM